MKKFSLPPLSALVWVLCAVAVQVVLVSLAPDWTYSAAGLRAHLLIAVAAALGVAALETSGAAPRVGLPSCNRRGQMRHRVRTSAAAGSASGSGKAPGTCAGSTCAASS